MFRRLALQLAACGACRPDPRIRLTLACGNIRNDTDRAAIKAHFNAQDWDLWDEDWLRSRLKVMAKRGYENQISAVVAKVLLRGAGA